MMAVIKKHIFKSFCLAVFGFIIMLGLVFVYVKRVKPYAEQEQKLISVQYETVEEKVENGTVLTQSFDIKEEIKCVKVNLSYKSENEKQIVNDQIFVSLQNKESGKVLQEWTLRPEDIIENKGEFKVDKDLGINSNGYVLEIRFEGENEYSNFSFYKTEINQYNAGELKINGENVNGDLAFVVFGGNNAFLYNLFTVLVIGFAIFGILLWYVIFKRKLSIEKIAFILILFLGINHMVLMPTYSTPDERAHFSTVYFYSNVLMGQEAIDKDGNVLVRNEDLLLNVENTKPSLGTYALIGENLFEKCQDDSMVSYDRPPLSVPFWSYFPQILGVSLARICNMGNIMLLFLGSTFALLFYCVCVTFSIKLMPFGKSAMMVMALFPMTLETASSFSYDVLVNGLSFLFIGYVFHLAYNKREADWKDWVALTSIIFLLTPIKVVYVFLAALCFMIPKNNRTHIIGITSVWLFGVVSILVLRLTSIVNLASNSTSAIGKRNTYTISYILENIPKVVGVLYNTLRDMTDAILSPLIGHHLGWWDVVVPYYIAYGFVFLLMVAMVMVKGEKVYIKEWHKFLMCLVAISTTGGIALALMLDFTEVTDTMVRGIQGRYFVPILPLIVYSCRNDLFVLKKNIDSYIAVSAYLLNYFVLWRIFETVVAR